jgi:hypothetical protein
VPGRGSHRCGHPGGAGTGRSTIRAPSRPTTMANGNPVGLQAEADVVRVDPRQSLPRTLRKRGRPTGVPRTTEVGSRVHLGGLDAPPDVLGARAILLGPALLAGDDERHLLGATLTQEPRGRTCHDETRAQQQPGVGHSEGAHCPRGGLLHDRAAGEVVRRQQGRGVERVEAGRGRTVLEGQPAWMTGLQLQGLLLRGSQDDLLGTTGEGLCGHRERAEDIDDDGDGGSPRHLGDSKETRAHPAHTAPAQPYSSEISSTGLPTSARASRLGGWSVPERTLLLVLYGLSRFRSVMLSGRFTVLPTS